MITWQKALEIKSDSPDTYQKMGKTYQLLADLPMAINAFQEVIRLKPIAWDVWHELAKLHLVFLNTQSAEECLQKAMTIQNDPSVWITQGDLWIIDNKIADAEIAYRKALDIQPNDPLAFIKLALCYLSNGDSERAEKSYQQTVLSEPDSEVLLYIHTYWKLKGDSEKAEEYILKLISKKPDDMWLQKMLADFYLKMNRFEEANDILDKILKMNPENRFIQKYTVEIFLEQNMMKEAEILIANLSQIKADDLELHLLQGKYHLLSLEPSLAASHFMSAMDIEPNLPISHYFLAIAYLYRGQNNLARERLIKALELNPDFSEAELALADIYYKNGEFDLSLEHAERIATKEPENFRAHLIMGNVFLAQGQYDTAIRKFQAVRELYPDLISPVYYIAVAAELSENTETALRIYDSLIKQHPSLIDSMYRYVKVLVKKNRVDEARQFLENAISNTSDKGYFHQLLGELHVIWNDLTKAADHFKQAIAHDPSLVNSYLKLARIYHQNNDLDGQIQILKTCLESNVYFIEAYLELANAYQAKGQWEMMTETLEHAIRLNPESPYLANNLAWIYLARDMNLNQALNHAQSAYDRLPKDPYVADTLGWAYYKKKSYTMAIMFLTDALARKPEHPIINHHLALAYHAAGDMAKAMNHLTRSLELNSDAAYHKEANELLQEWIKESSQ